MMLNDLWLQDSFVVDLNAQAKEGKWASEEGLKRT